MRASRSLRRSTVGDASTSTSPRRSTRRVRISSPPISEFSPVRRSNPSSRETTPRRSSEHSSPRRSVSQERRVGRRDDQLSRRSDTRRSHSLERSPSTAATHDRLPNQRRRDRRSPTGDLQIRVNLSPARTQQAKGDDVKHARSQRSPSPAHRRRRARSKSPTRSSSRHREVSISPNRHDSLAALDLSPSRERNVGLADNRAPTPQSNVVRYPEEAFL